jgi:kumamolisin
LKKVPLRLLYIAPVVLFTHPADPQEAAKAALGAIQIPFSSIRRPQVLAAGAEQEALAFTNVQVFIANAKVQPPTAMAGETTGFFIETPASVACLYSLSSAGDAAEPGCSPNVAKMNSAGGSKAIAIVDAFDAPNLLADLKVFSQRFNLPPAEFEIIFASGTRPQPNSQQLQLAKGWELEESLDVEWAHAVAPGAKLVLVEAASNSLADLLVAEDLASKWVSNQGGGEISNSWGVPEFDNETTSDFEKHFTTEGVVYFAASGDLPGVNWPSTSANVVCVGGTGIVRTSSGYYVDESAWSYAGAGKSDFADRPKFQDPVGSQVGGRRGCVDVAAIADPANGGGVWVYDSTNSNVAANDGWVAVGGTSVATPIVAAMTNLSGRFATTSQDELTFIYANQQRMFQVKSGWCGPIGQTMSAGIGWNFCTGNGRPVKAAL